jgi:hypothetical protein
MYNKKMLLMPHLPTPVAGMEDVPGRSGSGKSLNIWTLHIKAEFFLQCLCKFMKGMLLRLGCIFNSKWHYLNHNSICTMGQVLKINNFYAYKEDSDIDIVRLTDVHIERGFLYCSLFFFSKNRIITVRQSLLKDVNLVWRLMNIEEYNELKSMSLWDEISKQEELLEFDF